MTPDEMRNQREAEQMKKADLARAEYALNEAIRYAGKALDSALEARAACKQGRVHYTTADQYVFLCDTIWREQRDQLFKAMADYCRAKAAASQLSMPWGRDADMATIAAKLPGLMIGPAGSDEVH